MVLEKPCLGGTLHTGQFTWAVGNRRAHVHEAEGTARQRFPAAGATGDFGLGGGAADTILAEAAALVRHRRAAVRDGLPTEVAAHKHLPHGNKHKGQMIRQWNLKAKPTSCTLATCLIFTLNRRGDKRWIRNKSNMIITE